MKNPLSCLKKIRTNANLSSSKWKELNVKLSRLNNQASIILCIKFSNIVRQICYLLKHSVAVFLSSLIPPPPTIAGRSPPTNSTSSSTHPAPDLLLVAGRARDAVPLSRLVDGVQNPSPFPQKPKLQEGYSWSFVDIFLLWAAVIISRTASIILTHILALHMM